MPITLLVITGLPASGKTYLGSRLASQLGWPLVSKDEYKEMLHNHLPDLTRQQAGPLSFEIMYHVAGVSLAAGVNVVLETHFHRGVSEPILTALAEKYGATIIQVFCHAPLTELMRRHDERVAVGDHPHIHQSWLYKTPVPDYACSEPLVLGGELFRLETTRPDAVSDALAWVKTVSSILPA